MFVICPQLCNLSPPRGTGRRCPCAYAASVMPNLGGMPQAMQAVLWAVVLTRVIASHENSAVGKGLPTALVNPVGPCQRPPGLPRESMSLQFCSVIRFRLRCSCHAIIAASAGSRKHHKWMPAPRLVHATTPCSGVQHHHLHHPGERQPFVPGTGRLWAISRGACIVGRSGPTDSQS